MVYLLEEENNGPLAGVSIENIRRISHETY